MKVVNTILGYKDLVLVQDTDMFRFSLDTILLARFVKLNSKTKMIADFGTNNAVIPLIISKYTNAKIVGVEIQKDAFNIALENIKKNNLQSRIEVLNQNIKDFAKSQNHNFDIVICNPPFFKVNEGSNLNEKSELLTPARHETHINLEEIIACAAKCLKQGGRFSIVHRAERFEEILNHFNKYEIKAKNLQFVYSKAGQKAKTVLIDGIYQGNSGITILPPLIAHYDNGEYTKEVLELFED
ncbi:methyltransferase [Spiroplasma sabaudiense Ar-1343]|uniref:Methyltransferase n=1 Tax=Spiroplasma sabaudiense Ar-1343 TaxID=1276257 RepID=W6A8D2_9MOLU|nr:tRNA1(Val) (adenine(37)-N6)-methyltransferase [Spiroplasma sabaudiense]AHI53423.1 methyltransferase [Spiroplasma sabaudiense Ar-1343]